MNYEDFTNIEKDDKKGMEICGIEIIGFHRPLENTHRKEYIVLCESCKERDPELFGDGLFTAHISNLYKGAKPCGCTSKYRWNQKEAEILISRICNEKGYQFLGFVGEYDGGKTRLILKCPKHGKWDSTVLTNFRYSNVGCIECGRVSKQCNNEDQNRRLLAKGGFADGTVLTKLVTCIGENGYYRQMFSLYCPICQETGISCFGNISQGFRPCGCGKKIIDQNLIYILKITEDVYKFGITRQIKQRLAGIKKKSKIGGISLLLVWKFPMSNDCSFTEQLCKKAVCTGVISREDLPDGHTETFYSESLETLIKIIEDNGGEKLYDSSTDKYCF